MAQKPGQKKVKSLLPSSEEIEQALEASLQAETPSSGTPMGELKDIRPQTLVKGRVLKVDRDEVLVDLSYKAEGVLALEEFAGSGPRVGDEVEAWVQRLEDADGQVQLSLKEANRQKIFAGLEDGCQQLFTGKVIQAVKGGLVVDIGVRAFLPAREVGLHYVEDLEALVGQRMEVAVLETDRERERVVVSRRAVLRQAREAQKAELLRDLKEGDLRHGVVSSVMDFGAFVDLGGVEGLIHRNDLAWGRVGHPSEVLQPGQEVEVTVLSIDKEEDRIGLGLKQVGANDPWADVPIRFAPGRRAQGKVAQLLPFGAVVELEPGVEGLVHVSEMRWGRRVNRPQDVVSVGDEVEVEVLEILPEKRRLSLSMKKVEANPWSHLEDRYPFATIVRGQVSRIVEFGAFVVLPDGVEGLVHISELSWTRRYQHPSECLEDGQQVTAIVIGASEAEQRLSLSIKQTEPDPWWDAAQDFPVGAEVEGCVAAFKSFGALVELRPGLLGLIHVSALGRSHVARPQEVLRQGQRVLVEVLEVSEQERRMGLRLVEKLA